MDASLCHGAAGLCWFGARAGEEWNLADTGRFNDHWTTYVSTQRADGPLHYLVKGGFNRNYSFLEGDLGVASALVRLATGRPAAWEQRMLGSVLSPPDAIS